MAIAFTYTKSTNTVVVTGGTSGTPATFADFVTADRAGSVTLLAAWAPISNTKALTYQITPVEKLGLIISFVIAGKTAETDYIFITGTDAWGNAQTESINVTAGNGTYASVLHWRTITNIDCSDNPVGNGTVWANGTVAVTQPQWGVIWNLGNGLYTVDSSLNIGNGSTATYMRTSREAIIFPSSHFYVTENATFQIGKLQGSWGYDGSYIAVTPSAASPYWGVFVNGGTILIYASLLRHLGSGNPADFYAGTVKIKNSIFLGAYSDDSAWQRRFSFDSGLTTCEIEDAFFANTSDIFLSVTPGVFSDIHSHYNHYGIECQASGVVASGLRFTEIGISDILTWTSSSARTIICKDPKIPINGVYHVGNADSWAKEAYTCNINICDKDGTAINGATVLCEDKDGNDIFSVNTNASGNITEQTIIYKHWQGLGSPVPTIYSPHKFTISKAGYQTLVLENITVDHPIVWHLELQQPSGGGAEYKNIGIGVN